MKGHAYAVPFAALVFILPFPGTVALRLLCLAGAFLYAAFTWRRLDPPAIPAKLSLLLWASLAAWSVTYSFDVGYSLSEFKNEVGYSMMAYLAFFAFALGEKELRVLLAALVAGTLVIAAWGLVTTIQVGVWQEAGGHGGVGSTSALFCVSAPLIALSLAVTRNRDARRVLTTALLLLLAAGIATRQRILFPVFLVEFILGAVLLKWTGFLSWSGRKFAVALGAVVVIAALSIAVVQMWRQETGAMREVDIRSTTWPTIVDHVMKKPWQGAGFGLQAMRKAYPELVPKGPTLFWHAHNVFLNAAISMGIPGALALLLVFANLAAVYARLLRCSDEQARLIGIAGLLLLVGVVGRNLTNDFFVRDGALLFWSLNGALLGAGLRREREAGSIA